MTTLTKGSDEPIFINAGAGPTDPDAVHPSIGKYVITQDGVPVTEETYFHAGALQEAEGVCLQAFLGGAGQVKAVKLKILSSAELEAGSYEIRINSGNGMTGFYLVPFDLV